MFAYSSSSAEKYKKIYISRFTREEKIVQSVKVCNSWWLLIYHIINLRWMRENVTLIENKSFYQKPYFCDFWAYWIYCTLYILIILLSFFLLFSDVNFFVQWSRKDHLVFIFPQTIRKTWSGLGRFRL